jgi:hypothetical protein
MLRVWVHQDGLAMNAHEKTSLLQAQIFMLDFRAAR